MADAHGTSRDDPGLSAHPQARRTYLLRGRVRCRPCQRRMYGMTRTSSRYYTPGAADVDHVYYLCPHDPANPAHHAQAPDHPATVSVREDLLVELARQFLATRALGPDRAALLPATAAEDAARRGKEAARLRTRLRKIDTTEDAHVREVQALAEHDPNSPAVKAMRERHLRAFADLETERDVIAAKLAALAKQADNLGGDPGLLDELPMLRDLPARLPNRIKAQLFEAFDLAILYNKKDGQITCRAIITITPATPHALAAIIADSETPDLTALLTGQDQPSDLSRHPGATKTP